MGAKSLSPKEIGALVRETRTNAGLTQAELGERIGASRYWVAAFERGKPGAELGKTLKALRALRLVVTIEPRDKLAQPEEPAKVDVDLSSLLDRTRQHYWPVNANVTPDSRYWRPESTRSETLSVDESEKRKKRS